VKIEIGGIEALSKDYHYFDEFTDELVDHEDAHGRRVPDYDIGVLLPLIVGYLLKKAIDKLIDVAIDEALEERRRRKDAEAAYVRDRLEEQRYLELLSSIEELKRAMQQGVEIRPPNSALTEDAASLSAFLQWARDNEVKITITLETEAEGDLREAFEAATKYVPGSSVNDSRRQIE
jgi:hypothetical protein